MPATFASSFYLTSNVDCRGMLGRLLTILSMSNTIVDRRAYLSKAAVLFLSVPSLHRHLKHGIRSTAGAHTAWVSIGWTPPYMETLALNMSSPPMTCNLSSSHSQKRQLICAFDPNPSCHLHPVTPAYKYPLPSATFLASYIFPITPSSFHDITIVEQPRHIRPQKIASFTTILTQALLPFFTQQSILQK